MMRIMIVDDHQIVRHGMRHLLESQSDMEVVAEADSGQSALRRAREHQPDVILMDISMPDMNGIEVTRRIIASLPDVRVLVLSMHSNRRFVTEALAAGATGYLLKDCAFDELIGAIRCVAAGETYLSPKIAGHVVRGFLDQRTVAAAATHPTLSVREREVLQLIAEGKNVKEVAFLLEISTKTVETHRMQIMKKLDIRNVAQLTKYAIREGLTSLD
ncbi:LuxR family transcriptional regulator [Geobacter pickeringii]|uniref:LuxR family transcriptional regulator n=2 Tax=Geobacter pickeringii TaxID=345632 RepID=A0A0B5BFV0_9BACT|nr:LuxR family transcriptional regulator [Geobacter pickeringii]